MPRGNGNQNGLFEAKARFEEMQSDYEKELGGDVVVLDAKHNLIRLSLPVDHEARVTVEELVELMETKAQGIFETLRGSTNPQVKEVSANISRHFRVLAEQLTDGLYGEAAQAEAHRRGLIAAGVLHEIPADWATEYMKNKKTVAAKTGKSSVGGLVF